MATAFQSARMKQATRKLNTTLRNRFVGKKVAHVAAGVGARGVYIEGKVFRTPSTVAVATMVNAGRPASAQYVPQSGGASGSIIFSGGLADGSTVVTPPTDPRGGSSAGLTAHAAKDYIEAHPTNVPTVNRNGVYYSYNFGIRGGYATDEADRLLAMFNTVGAAGGGTCIIRSANGVDPIYINKVASIYYSNVHVVFRSPVTYGTLGSVRIMGENDEFSRRPGGLSAGLSSSSYENVDGETVLPLRSGEGVYFNVGDKIVVRGENDISGKALTKDVSYIKSISTDALTLADALDYTFDPTYPGSSWPSDLTTGTTVYVVRFSEFTANTNVGAMVVTVVDASAFVVGDLMFVSDSRTEYDYNNSAVSSTTGLGYKNPANQEMIRITAISGNDVTLDRALSRSYLTAYHGGLSRMLPVRNSSISGAQITYVADGVRSSNSLQITYGENCHIFDCVVDGLNGRRGQAIRLANSLNCSAYRNVVRDAKYLDSGLGYGITAYYSTLCRIYDNVISGCRHSILVQQSTLTDIYNNESRDDRISGIDLHGVNALGTHIHGNRITRSILMSPSVTNGSGIRTGNTSHTCGDLQTTVENNFISGYLGSTQSAIDFIPASSDVLIRNNTIIDCGIGIRFTRNSSSISPTQTITGVVLDGNYLLRCAVPIEIVGASTGAISRLTMITNISDGNSKHFTASNVDGHCHVIDNIILNPVASSGQHGYDFTSCTGLIVKGNSAHKANKGIKLTSCTNAVVAFNLLTLTVESVAFTDGGGNTSLINALDVVDGTEGAGSGGGGGGGGADGYTKFTRVLGSLSASATTTAVLPHNNSTVSIADGFEILTTSYSPTATGKSIRITAVVPYVQIATTGAVQVAVFVGTTCVGITTRRITSGGSSGGDLMTIGDYTSVVTSAVTISVRIGSDAGSTLTLNSKFNGLSQVYMTLEEFT